MKRKLATTEEEKKKLTVESVQAFRDAFPTLNSSVKQVVKDIRPQTGFFSPSQPMMTANERDFPALFGSSEAKKAKQQSRPVRKEPIKWQIEKPEP